MKYSARLSRLCLPPLSLCLAGCATIRGPKLPQAFIVTKTQDQQVVDEIYNYTHGLCDKPRSQEQTQGIPVPPSCSPTRQDRDRIIYELKAIIDARYQDYARGFERTEDGSNFAGEVTGAVLSGTAGIVGQVATKDILSLASTLTQSTMLSTQKNFYQKQTVYALLVVMDSQRADKWATILTEIKGNDEKSYTLEAALDDLLDYRQQGTALQALASIEKNAASVSDKADKTRKKQVTKKPSNDLESEEAKSPPSVQ